MAKKRQRTCKYLRPNIGHGSPQNLVFVQTFAQVIPDDENSNEATGRLDFGVAHALRRRPGGFHRWQKHVFRSRYEYWHWLYSRFRPNSSLWMIGHGVSKTFTYVDGWAEIEQGSLRFTKGTASGKVVQREEKELYEEQSGWFVDGDPPTILLLHHELGTLHVLDAENYGKTSIDELADKLGRKLRKRPRSPVPSQPWIDWLNERVIVVRDYFIQLCNFWDEHQLGVFRHTAASCAMAAYRHKFLSHRILIHDNQVALELERAALAGAEFRCFKIGRWSPWLAPKPPRSRARSRKPEHQHLGPVHAVDCNSLYPYVMANNLMPAEHCAWKPHASIDDYLAWRKQLLLIARVEIDCRYGSYPTVIDGERVWAQGTFWTTLAGPELDQAVDRGHVVAWDTIAAYYPARIFDDFVAFFQSLKEKEPGLKGDLAKLFMVSLAGKFAQKAPDWDFVSYFAKGDKRRPAYGAWSQLDADTGEIRNFRAFCGYTQMQGIDQESLESCPAITAFVTSYARLYMQRIIGKIGVENVFYQGNDALLVNDAGLIRLRPWMESRPGELGKFRHQGTFQNGEIRGPHDYTIGEELVVAGRKHDVEEQTTNSYTQLETAALATILCHQPNGYMRIKRVTKTVGKYHPRGIINPDGSVSPPQVFGAKIYWDRKHPQAIPFQATDTHR